MKHSSTFCGLTFVILGCALVAVAQTPSTPREQTPSSPPPAASAAAAPVWSLGSLDFSGFIDGYYSFNGNRPSNSANGQVNELYNFNDKTDQFNLSAAKLTVNHDADPIGARIDILFGRTNALMHGATELTTDNFIEQAYISAKPGKTHGAEFDFGQFVTSAGAEVIEAKDDWNYSRSLLFAWAIPYYHFGFRSTIPVTKTWTAGLQLVNGWNNVVDNNGGVTVGLTSLLTEPKFGWALNYYTGPENTDTQKGYRNLIDTTLTLTPTSRFNAYINYDYGQNRMPAFDDESSESSLHWQGIAFAARGQVSGKSALAGRYEYYSDQGFQTGVDQHIQEFTATYEYKWLSGVLMRAEFRRDWSNEPYFAKGDSEFVTAQTTGTVALIAFFGPKR